MTHSELVEVARKWLLRHHPIVITEISGYGEEPDALGWQAGISTLIEVKATRSDYYADTGKPFRVNGEQGIGNYRYYFAPKGIIVAENVREKWGLLEYDGKRVYKTKAAEFWPEINHTQEKRILISTLRRVGQTKPPGVSISAYYYTTENRASLSIDLDCDR